MNTVQTMILGLLFSFSSVSIAAEEMDHSQHEMHMNTKPAYQDSGTKGELDALAATPESGKSREAGFDKRYTMEPTSAGDKLADLCAKGSRGLVILDRQTWEKCGGAPKGAPEPYDSKKSDAQTSHQH